MFLLSTLAVSIEYTGKQTSALELTATQDILIQDCQFYNLGRAEAYPPVRILQGTPTISATITECMFTKCQAQWGGAFSFEGGATFNVQKTIVDNCQSGSFKNYGSIGYINPTSNAPYTLTLNSFANCDSGKKALNCFGTGKLSFINSTANKVYYTLFEYACGVIALQECQDIEVSYSNLYKCYSSCGVVYALKPKGTCTIKNCNFVENTDDGWALIGSESAQKSMIVDSCTFVKNTYNGHEIFGTYSGQPIIATNCQLDYTKVAGSISSKDNVVTSATEVPIAFYATGNIGAKIPYTTPNGNQPSNPATGATPIVPVIPGDQPATGNTGDNQQTGNEDTGDIPVISDDSSNTNNSHVANADSGVGGKNSGKSTPMWVLAIIAGVVVLCALVIGFIGSKFYEKRLDESDSQYSNQESEDTEHIEIPPQQPEEQQDEEPIDPDLNVPDLTSMELTPDLTSKELNGTPEDNSDQIDDE